MIRHQDAGNARGARPRSAAGRGPARQSVWRTRLLPGGIRARLFLLIALALLPALLLQGWTYYQHYATRRSQALQTELEVAQGVATTFSAYVDGVRQHLDMVGKAIISLSSYTDVQVEFLLQVALGRYSTVRSMGWAGPDGILLVSSLPGNTGRGLSLRPDFMRTLIEQSWAISDLTASGITTSAPTVVIGTAIRDDSGVLRGVALASIDPARLGELTLTQERPAGGTYTIFDSRGVVVYYHSNESLTWDQRLGRRESDSALQRVMETGRAHVGVTHLGVPEDRWLLARTPIGDTGWVAGAARPADVALAPVWRGLLQDAGLGLGIVSLALLLAYLLAHTIAEPLQRLQGDARAMGQGRIEASDDAEAPAEVRSLRDTVTAMAGALIQRADALRRSERRFRRLFEANLAGVYITKLDGTILDFNDAMMRMLGYDSRDEVFQHRSTDFYADPEFRNELLRLLRENGVVPGKEAVLKRKDGSVLNALGAAVLLADEQTGDPYIQGVAIDITDRKRMEESLRDLTATLESKVAQRTAELEHRARQLQRLTLELSQAEDRERKRVAGILHDDLQQVLAGAKFHLGLLADRNRDSEESREIVRQIKQMIQDAIEKSRSLSHELSPAVLHQSDLEGTLNWLAHQMQSKYGLTVHMAIQGPIDSRSEPLRAFLYKATQELLFNVVKHARVNEARIRVRQLGRYICLSVSDRGHGFDPQRLGEIAGFGLLSIRERVELLGGRMKVRSATGKGSTFCIVVPHRESSGKQAGARQEPHGRTGRDEQAQGQGDGRLRILLADDHAVVRQGIVLLLGEEPDIEVVAHAANGREAVDLAYQFRPDVVVMDASMPLMSGAEAARQIKRYLPQTRIIALSMHEEDEMAERMRRAGAEAYVLKTAPSEDLLAAIRGKTGSVENIGSNA